jgi:hypothetical protein
MRTLANVSRVGEKVPREKSRPWSLPRSRGQEAWCDGTRLEGLEGVQTEGDGRCGGPSSVTNNRQPRGLARSRGPRTPHPAGLEGVSNEGDPTGKECEARNHTKPCKTRSRRRGSAGPENPRQGRQTAMCWQYAFELQPCRGGY